MKRILLAEDEKSLGEGLVFNLRDEGFDVTWVQDGKTALEQFQTAYYDLIILDIMMPYLDGFEVTGKIRERNINIPILMLTAREQLHDKIHGLKIGADDYLTKPFHLQELLARIEVLLRRSIWSNEAQVPNIFIFGDNEINFDDLSAKTPRGTFQLTLKEAEVMRLFISNKGKIVSRKELLSTVWNISYMINTRTVDNFIARLRKYFESDSKNPRYIKSIRGTGYLFDVD
ncbi:MAG: response regulator transcription factor [Candidatus Marinimicrobia bacterium]|nr:response regulator transcription factor [Candidatus Neomarinimicrobiota bacterium]